MKKDKIMRNKKKIEFMPNTAYGDLKYAVKVYRDWWYNNCLHTDYEGILIGEKFDFIVSEGKEPCIKRFKYKGEASKWIEENRSRFWPARDPEVVKLKTPKQIKEFEKMMKKTCSPQFACD